MQYTHLGRTGIKVSPIARTMEFGWHIDEFDGVTIMDAALDAGINIFDMVMFYFLARSRPKWKRAMASLRRSSAVGSRRAVDSRLSPSGRRHIFRIPIRP